jgi:hypothetical protein
MFTSEGDPKRLGHDTPFFPKNEGSMTDMDAETERELNAKPGMLGL